MSLGRSRTGGSAGRLRHGSGQAAAEGLAQRPKRAPWVPGAHEKRRQYVDIPAWGLLPFASSRISARLADDDGGALMPENALRAKPVPHLILEVLQLP